MDPSHGGERGGGKNNVKAVSDVKKRVDREDGFEKEEPYLMVNEEKDSTAWIAFCPAELQKPVEMATPWLTYARAQDMRTSARRAVLQTLFGEE